MLYPESISMSLASVFRSKQHEMFERRINEKEDSKEKTV
jgi:hypothetical protein